MKRVAKLLILAVMFASANAMAYYQVNFQTDLSDGSGGNPANDALYSSADNSTPLGTYRLFLVYYSLDNSTSGFNNVDPYTPSGDEYIGAFTTGLYAGEIYGNNAVTLGTPTQTGYGGGYVYMAVFNLSYSGGAAPSIPGGTSYALGTTRLTSDFQEVIDGGDPAPLPYNYGTLKLEVTPLHTTLTTVPEPSSVALLGIGLGLVALRRMRK